MKVNPQHAMDVMTPGMYICMYRERERECPKRRRVEDVGGWRSVSWADVAARGRVQVEETEVISVGLVDPEKRSAETRAEEIGREAGALEAIAGLQEMEGMVIEDLSREVGEEVSVDTMGLGLMEESTKKEGGQGTDTQQPDGKEGMAHTGVEEGKLRVRAVYLTWVEG
jgi:hypothetical protein